MPNIPEVWMRKQKGKKFKVNFGLHSELKPRLGYTRPYIQNKTKQNILVNVMLKKHCGTRHGSTYL